jgi:bacterioferritin-associated ferredoxin
MARLICRCMGLSSRRIEAVVRERSLADLDAIAAETGAGGGCGSCRTDLQEILAEVRGEPVPESVRRANRARVEAEALRRVEAALYGSVCARLPAGTQIELISVAGLRVELHVARGDAPELRALVSERLAKLVCVELEIAFV